MLPVPSPQPRDQIWVSSIAGRFFTIWATRGQLIINAAAAAAAAAKSLQSSPTLCDPRDSSPPGSPVPGILQARTMEWVAISFSNAWKWKVKVKLLNRVWLFVTLWTVTCLSPLSMGFSRQEYWSGLPCPSPQDLPDPGIEPRSPTLRADTLQSEPPGVEFKGEFQVSVLG